MSGHKRVYGTVDDTNNLSMIKEGDILRSFDKTTDMEMGSVLVKRPLSFDKDFVKLILDAHDSFVRSSRKRGTQKQGFGRKDPIEIPEL